jgi:hypothetical protein
MGKLDGLDKDEQDRKIMKVASKEIEMGSKGGR